MLKRKCRPTCGGIWDWGYKGAAECIVARFVAVGVVESQAWLSRAGLLHRCTVSALTQRGPEYDLAETASAPSTCGWIHNRSRTTAYTSTLACLVLGRTGKHESASVPRATSHAQLARHEPTSGGKRQALTLAQMPPRSAAQRSSVQCPGC